MFSWQSSFFFQYIIEKYQKEDERGQEEAIKALVEYRLPDLFIKYIIAKGNPAMLSPNLAHCLYNLTIDYCMSCDYQINLSALIQIIDFLMKILLIRQTPKLFQKIEPFFFVVFGSHHSEIEKLYSAMKNISILALTYFSFLYNYKINEVYTMLLNSADQYINSNNCRIWIQSLSALFKSGVSFKFDLLSLYALCDKVSNIYYLPLYFRSTFFDNLTYFLSPMNSFQIAKTHFFKISGQITTESTANDLVSLLQYSKHLAILRKKHEITAFTIDMISEIVFSSILPHFRKSKKLNEALLEYCNLIEKDSLSSFITTHFPTSSQSSQQFLISHTVCDVKNLDLSVLFIEPVDHEIIHQFIENHKIPDKFIVHFLEFSSVGDFPHIFENLQKKPKILCEKIIQFLSICDDIEKMNTVLSYLMKTFHNIPLVSHDELNLAFLNVSLEIVQYPNNQNNKYFYIFLEYLRQCKDFNEKSPLPNPNTHEVTLKKTPKRTRRISNETPQSTERPRRLSDSQSIQSPSSNQNDYKLLRKSMITQSPKDMFITPKKPQRRTSTTTFKIHLDEQRNEKKYKSSAFIQQIVNSCEYWNEELLSLLFTKIEKNDLRYGVLVSFFSSSISIYNQIGKIVSPHPRLLKLFFSTTLSMNNYFILEMMKYIFYHKDLIPFRIELILNSLLAVSTLAVIDDTVVELFKLGFHHHFYDLTCSVISSLLDVSPFVSDHDEFIQLMCKISGHCDSLVFYTAFSKLIQNCDDFQESTLKIIFHTWATIVKDVNDSNFEEILLTKINDISDISGDKSPHISQKLDNVLTKKSQKSKIIQDFVEEIRINHSKSFGYFNCLQRLSNFLSFDQISPLIGILALNLYHENKAIREMIQNVLQKLFKDNNFLSSEPNTDSRSSSKINAKYAPKLIQSMFNVINFQDNKERKALFYFLRRFTDLYPKALVTFQPPLIPQIISAFSDTEIATINSKYGKLLSDLAKSDIVFFYNQLLLSPKCPFFNNIVKNLCFVNDEGSQLFSCIENEFQELRDRTIDFQFNFYILSNYIQYQFHNFDFNPNFSKQDHDNIDLNQSNERKMASLLLIMFLCISESFIKNDKNILSLLRETFSHVELVISIPLMPSTQDSIERIFELIPFPLFSNKIILLFLSKCENLNSTKHQNNFEILVSSLLVSFSGNQEIFPRLIDLYFKGQPFNFTKVSKVLSKNQLKMCSNKIKEIFDFSIKEGQFNTAATCALFVNEGSYFTKIFNSIHIFESSCVTSPKFCKCIQKAKKLGFFKFDIDNDLLSILQDSLFDNNQKSNPSFNNALNVMKMLLKCEKDEFPFKSLFFFYVGNASIEKYVQFVELSIEKFNILHKHNISCFELKLIFSIIDNLIGLKEYEEIVASFYGNLLDHHLSKEAKAIATSLVQQYKEDPFSISFPTITKPSKNEMCHI